MSDAAITLIESVSWRNTREESMPPVLRIFIAVSIAFVGTMAGGLIGELYGSWPKLGTMAAFGIATGIFWVRTGEK